MKPISRRSLLQTAGAAGIAGVVAAGGDAAAREQETLSFKTQLKKPKAGKPNVADLGALPATNISPDGLAINVLFDKAMELGLAEGEELTATLIASLLIPVSAQEPTVENFRGYSAFVRGFVTKDPGTRVVLALDLGETHDVAEFPYGENVSKDFQRSIFSYPNDEMRRAKPDGGQETARTSPAPHFPVVMTLTIQRRSPRDKASIKVDSLDVEIVDPAKAPAGGEGASGKKDSGKYGRGQRSR